MKSLGQQIENLERFLRNLTHLGEGDIYVNFEEVIRLNKEIRAGIEVLYPKQGCDANEEAALCSALLHAYSCLMYQDTKDEARKQALVERSAELLRNLPVSFVKCRLLVYCYGEVNEPDFASEAHALMDSWQGRTLSEKEQELVNTLRLLEENHSSL